MVIIEVDHCFFSTLPIIIVYHFYSKQLETNLKLGIPF